MSQEFKLEQSGNYSIIPLFHDSIPYGSLLDESSSRVMMTCIGRDQMIEDTLEKIESRLKAADSISDERRRELLNLIAVLKSEVGALSKTHEEEAESIAEFAKLSTHEATRSEQNPQLLKLSLEGLNSSVQGFEKSHPRLVQIVGAVTNTLSNLGI